MDNVNDRPINGYMVLKQKKSRAKAKDELYFNINETAKQIEVVPATIRNWEKQGLFKARRASNGYRIFSLEDIERLKKIKHFSKDENMGANAIQFIMEYGLEEALPRREISVSKKFISRKWKQYRLERGYSLDYVAQSIGISASYLWKIENAQANSSFEIMEKLSDFYGESILYYMADNIEEKNVTKKDSGERLEIGLPGLSIESLGGLMNFSISPMIYTIEPQGGSRVDTAHRGEEFVYVLSGKIEFNVAGRKYMLSAGDSICFRSTDSHGCHNPGKVTARLLWVLSMGRRHDGAACPAPPPPSINPA